MTRLIHTAAAIALLTLANGLGAAELRTQLAALDATARPAEPTRQTELARLAAFDDVSRGVGGPETQTELAAKYENAEGVPKDLQAARRLYCLAAKQGYAEAQFRLGWMYANGRGGPRDDSVAAALFKMAADQGYVYAAKLLPYLREQPDTQMPSCLLPDPPATAPAPAQAALEDDAAPAGDRGEIEQLVRRLAPQYAVDWKLALAVIRVESGFNAAAVSPKNAQGLMQLIPETAARFGVKKVFNAVDNIKGGLAYLRWLLAFFEGDVPLVVAAYNAGERAVEKYRGIPPYPETRDYVRKITGVYTKTRHPYESFIVEPSPIMARMNSARR